jgi:hypothetical protein
MLAWKRPPCNPLRVGNARWRWGCKIEPRQTKPLDVSVRRARDAGRPTSGALARASTISALVAKRPFSTVVSQFHFQINNLFLYESLTCARLSPRI